ncbi:DUF2878 domain-containing protein [Halomonas urumqiensis]|uniref:DUF2878 domain-containing protein n=1 Tax=Halomonas urumqiensis TaxID=1684789 RepID=A0A2N7UI18_9GAMM|nr:DUF2878 domain-containing protein [Halomonas urumqiensis]PMR80098.1 DUF2878 domain-containing protein [Halomonas urumqiensis]PTB01267.1 DUF2878 domain-containing protein [Halomonas urumqiensis]GHE22638.1 membrane protein [Halomonas urumqiensis]
MNTAWRKPGAFQALLNVAAFQVGWFACVLGGSLIGAVVAAVILTLHLRWLARPHEWRWIAGFAALGLIVDGSLALAGGFDFGAQPLVLGVLPLWLWLLWPLFATLLHHSLDWLWRRPWLAMLGGATSGPSSYFAGAHLADVTLAPWLLPVQAIVWALLCLALCRCLGGETPGPTDTRH